MESIGKTAGVKKRNSQFSMAKMAGEDKWREKFEREKKGRSNFNREQLLSSAPFRNCR